MGSIKNTPIRSLGKQLLAVHRSKFTADFAHNKEALNGIQPIKSKRVKNQLAGFITNQIKR